MIEQEILREFRIFETGSSFIAKNFEILQKKFGGRFVAIKETDVLASAESFQEVIKQVSSINVNQNEVIIQFIPAEGEIILY